MTPALFHPPAGQSQGCPQRGFTLVELIVALAVSLILLAGVIQVYLSSKQAYRVQDNIARIQENGRLAIDFLSRYIRLAGYRSTLRTSSDQIFTAGTNQVISGTETSGQPDSVTVNFQSDGDMVDCLGNSVSDGFLSRDTFQLTGGELQCRSQGNAATPTDTVQSLVGGIQDMQITYGVNAANAFPPVVSQYMTATQVSDANAWEKVVSVRVTLLVQSPEDNVADAPQAYTFNGTPTTPTDRRLRHVFTTTINLRNQTI
jgi:type IV pilus assembly protein PilW